LSAPFDLPAFHTVLVNPRVPTETRKVFAAFAGMHGSSEPLADPPRNDLLDYLKTHGNDLTPAATACVPIIGEVLDTLTALPGAQLARMSGSGSTCFALFASAEAARAAAEQLTLAQPHWWIAPATLR
jgi:4-diphosphocytidyl-2-C-methyl-D-erythritol kinase